LKNQALLNGKRINILFFMGVFIFFGVFYALINLKTLDIDKPWRRDLVAVMLIVGIAAFLRIQAVNLLDTKPISDFAGFDNLAREWLQGVKHPYLFAPYGAMYAAVLEFVYSVFTIDIKVAKYLNILCALPVVVFLYFLGKKISQGKWQVGIAAALIFACWPAMLAYSGVLSSENIFVFFLALVTWVYSLIRDYWRRLNLWQLLACYSVLGMLISLMDFFKSVALVFLIALLIIELITRHSGILYNRKTWLKVVACLAACFLVYTIVNQALFAFLDYQTQSRINRDTYAYTFFIGMNFNSGGTFSAERAGEYFQLLAANHNDFQKTGYLVLQKTFAEIAANPGKILPLWTTKFNHVWESDDVLLSWAIAEKLHPQAVYLGNDFYNYITPAMDYFFTFILLLSAFGSFYAIFRKPNAEVTLVSLFILGVALLLLITEAQQRYRSVLTPALALTAAWGLESISLFLHDLRDAFQRLPRRF
jgi:4-amino-4-deoxy-L-arabinose transferase-like glycosyltransferase